MNAAVRKHLDNVHNGLAQVMGPKEERGDGRQVTLHL
jgi:hypothetical protein